MFDRVHLMSSHQITCVVSLKHLLYLSLIFHNVLWIRWLKVRGNGASESLVHRKKVSLEVYS